MLTGWIHKGAIDPKAIFNLNKERIRGILGQKEESKAQNLHWQCYVEFKKKIYATGVQKMFPPGQWRNKPAKATKAQNVVYCSKSDSKKGPYFELGEFAVAGKANALTALETMVLNNASERDCWKFDFPTMVKHHKGVRRGITMLQNHDDVAIFEQDKFPWTEEHKLDWSKTIVLWGASGIGKTQWALSLFKKPLFVTHLDQLGAFDNSYDGIVFDDLNLTGDASGKGSRFREAQIHLADQDNTRGIHIRYEVALIPAHTKKVWTTNVDNGWIFTLDDPAIRRRLQVIELKAFDFGNIGN